MPEISTTNATGMATSHKLPVTIVTGFLGAGKTTMLRALLQQSERRLAVLVNEFGDIGFDGSVLQGCTVCDGDASPTEGCQEVLQPTVVELANGCLCCTVQDEFLPVMLELLKQREKLDGIVIETSGLAMPQPLLEAFRWPALRTTVTVDSVITLVDGEAVAAGHVVGNAAAVERQRRLDPELDHLDSLEDLFVDQLRSADLVLISRADRLSPVALTAVRNRIYPHLRPGTAVMPSQQGQLPPALLPDPGPRTEPDLPAPGSSHHDHHDDHHHAPVTSVVLNVPGAWQRPVLEDLLREHLTAMAVLRAKGRATITGKALPLVIQAVGPRLDTWHQATVDTAGGLQLVLIGFAVDPDPLRTALLACNDAPSVAGTCNHGS